MSPAVTEEPLERRAIISGIGQSDVGRRLGRSRARPDHRGGAGRHRRRRADPRGHRRPLHLSRHGCRHRRLRRSDHARGPRRDGPVTELARRRWRGCRADARRDRRFAGRGGGAGPSRARLPHRDRGQRPRHRRPPGHRRRRRRRRRATLRRLHAVAAPLRRGLRGQLARHGGAAPHARVRPHPRAARGDPHQQPGQRRVEPEGDLPRPHDDGRLPRGPHDHDAPVPLRLRRALRRRHRGDRVAPRFRRRPGPPGRAHQRRRHGAPWPPQLGPVRRHDDDGGTGRRSVHVGAHRARRQPTSTPHSSTTGSPSSPSRGSKRSASVDGARAVPSSKAGRRSPATACSR